MNHSMPGLTVHHQLLDYTQTHVHWVSDAIQPPHPLSSPTPPASVFPSIRVFSNESALHIRWPKDWSFSFNISPSNEHPGLISFRMDWLDLPEVKETLKSLCQQRSIWSRLWFFQGLMLKLKLQYFGHLMRRADSFEKTWMLGKIEGRRRRGQQRMRWLDGITDSMDMGLGGL